MIIKIREGLGMAECLVFLFIFITLCVLPIVVLFREEINRYTEKNINCLKKTLNIKIKKTMSIISNALKSKENKALEAFDLGTTEQLTNQGRAEWMDFLFSNMPEQKAAFLAKIVEANEKK